MNIKFFKNHFAAFDIRLWYKTVCLILILLIFSPIVFGQSCIKAIDSDSVFQKRKKRFINNKYLQNISSFDELIPTCIDKKDSSSYNYQYETYYIKEDLNKVWNTYKSLSLPESYCGRIVSFGFLYSKSQKKLIYLDSKSFNGMKEGQVFFINLSFLGGFKRLIVAYEVTKIDDQNNTIQFCYINNGVSEGTQRIILSSTKEGYTKIQHNTVYKSQSAVRDKYIYPRFHKKIVKELHKNLIISLK